MTLFVRRFNRTDKGVCLAKGPADGQLSLDKKICTSRQPMPYSETRPQRHGPPYACILGSRLAHVRRGMGMHPLRCHRRGHLGGTRPVRKWCSSMNIGSGTV